MQVQAIDRTTEFDLPEDFLEPEPAHLPQKRPTVMNSTWPPGLVYDVALGIAPQEDFLPCYGMTNDDLIALYHNRIFTLEVANLRKELQEEGVTIRRKARTQFEGYLTNLDGIINDLDTPAATKVSAIQYIGKVGDVEPKKDTDDGKNVMQGVKIEINIG